MWINLKLLLSLFGMKGTASSCVSAGPKVVRKYDERSRERNWAGGNLGRLIGHYQAFATAGALYFSFGRGEGVDQIQSNG